VAELETRKQKDVNEDLRTQFIQQLARLRCRIAGLEIPL
jgi:hypothetical protein